MKLNNGKRMSIFATTTRKADIKDTISTLMNSNLEDKAILVENATIEYLRAKKNVATGLGKVNTCNEIEKLLRNVTNLQVQGLANAMNNVGSVKDFMLNVLSVNSFIMDTENKMYFTLKETIVFSEEFKESIMNPSQAIYIGTVNFPKDLTTGKEASFVNFGTENIRAMILDNPSIPETVVKQIKKCIDNKALELFDGTNQNSEFKNSMLKFEEVVKVFESVLDTVCIRTENGNFESITKKN
jgi:hypothetical protein